MSSLRLALKLSMADAPAIVVPEEKKMPKRKLSISEDDSKKKPDESFIASNKSESKSTAGGGKQPNAKLVTASKTLLEPILETVVQSNILPVDIDTYERSTTAESMDIEMPPSTVQDIVSTAQETNEINEEMEEE